MPVVDLVIKNVNLVTREGIHNAGLAVDNGKIAAVANDVGLPSADQVIDGGGKHLIPGFIDPEAHPGARRSFEQDMDTESRAVAAGGVTTWGLMTLSQYMSSNFKPTTDPEDIVPYSRVLDQAIALAEKNSVVDFFFSPHMQMEEHSLEIPELAKKYGITSFKYNLAYRNPSPWSGVDHSRIHSHKGLDDGAVWLGFENISKLGPPAIAMIHPENWEIVRIFQLRLMEEGRKDLAAWDDRSPHFLEAGHIRTYAYYARMANCPLYIVHTTTEESVHEIIKARAEGTKIVSQTAPHYLYLTKFDDPPGVIAKVNVPIRDPDTVAKLWYYLDKGVIDCVGSDHVNRGPRSECEVKGDVWATKSGFGPRGEVALPIMLSEGVNKGRISFTRLVEVTSYNTAKAMGLYPKKGALIAGADADFVLLDMKKTITIGRDSTYTWTDYNAFEGRQLTGLPIKTFVRGQLIFDRETNYFHKGGFGKYVKRKLGSQDYPLN